MKKLYIETHGCQMNEYDSARIADLLNIEESLELTSVPEEADVLLLNTCSIREKAQEKVFSELGRFRKLKNKKPNIIIGVGGCVASQEGGDILKRAPYVDVIFGPQTIHRLSGMIKDARRTSKPQIDISFPEIEKFDMLPEPSVHGSSAYVSIMEGCSKYCTFCVVPYTRGEEVSRPIDDVIAEIKLLINGGVKEITLLGQNVNAYRDSSSGKLIDFAELLHYVCDIDGLYRVRYTTSHPIELNEKVMLCHKELPNLVKYLHLPLQSGSDKILSAMKRGYTALEYKSKIRKLRELVPEILISSDFIIGFPGEIEDDFNKTMKMVTDMDFDYSFSFIYSARPGTPAANMQDNTPIEEKKRRLALLQHMLEEQGFTHSKSMENKVVDILVSDFSKKDPELLQGRTEHNRVVNFASNDLSLIGEIVKIRVTQAFSHSLRGELL